MTGEVSAEPGRSTAATGGDEDRLIAAVCRAMTAEPSLDRALAEIVALLAAHLDADGCLAYLVESSGDLVVAACHPGPVGSAEPLRLPPGFGVTGRVAVDAAPVTLVDDNPRNRRHRALLGLAEGDRVSRLCVPARLPNGGCAAVLAVHDRRHRVYLSSEVETAQRVADVVGLRVGLAAISAATERYRRECDELASATVMAQEAERRRIAGDLHDGVTQAIAGLTFHLSAAELALDDGDLAYVAGQVGAARALADVAFAEARSAITGLHSPILDDLGLAAGLHSLARSVPQLDVAVEAQEVELPDHVCVSLFRVAQEAVQNVVKHAGTSSAMIGLVRRPRAVVLTITDHGRGFEAPEHLPARPRGPHFGIAGMMERVHLIGGRLRITSLPAVGTTVEVVVPYDRPGSSPPAPLDQAQDQWGQDQLHRQLHLSAGDDDDVRP